MTSLQRMMEPDLKLAHEHDHYEEVGSQTILKQSSKCFCGTGNSAARCDLCALCVFARNPKIPCAKTQRTAKIAKTTHHLEFFSLSQDANIFFWISVASGLSLIE